MKKVVIFNGSPRKKGAVSQILNMIREGASEVGTEVKVYDLNDASVRGCQGCMYCKKNNVTVCAQKDSLATMYEDIREADLIVAGSPIYMYKVTAQMQTWINRLYPFMDASLKPLLAGKKIVTVYSQGNPDGNAFKDAMEDVKRFVNFIGWEEVERILSIGVMPSIPSPEVSKEILDKAYNIGKSII